MKLNITSAAGIICLLDEPIQELKVFALKKLDSIVDEFWPEISEAVEKIEILHEDKGFTQHDLAALVASKVYYHLGSFEDSLTYALGAGDLFDVNARNEYVDTIIAKCIDHYTQLRVQLAENPSKAKPIDARLEAIVNRMIQRCLDDGQYRQALGIALETRRMDIVESSIMKADDIPGMLAYAFRVTMSLIQNRAFRNTVLRCLVSLYRSLGVPDYVNICQCLIFLEDPLAVAELLDNLTKGGEHSVLMAYQIAFDLYESATQQFLGQVLQALKATAPIPSALISNLKPQGTNASAPEVKQEPKESEDGDTKIERTVESLNEAEKTHQTNIEKLAGILSGEVTIDLQLQFLIRSNHADLQILRATKEAVRVSICHTATVIANAFMHSGTTSDQFLRDNLEWLARATNWAKLTATASLGVIHRGHETESLALMQSYLPKESGPSSGYSEGGGLYALGLIHANHGANIIDYLLQQLKDAQNENVRHGGCLGLGLAAMGTHRQDVYEQLKFNLYQDDAVTGEAAGIAMGMVMLGSKHAPAIEDMVAYAQETQHEKILRGLAVGISLTMYARLEEADSLVTSLSNDKDPVLRRSGMYTVAMAYCGTGNNQAIRKLLHVAVSDVNDDVRRAAVTAIGFILFRTPEQCPSVVSLLAESYNPHVRYGAAMALGIACAGTGLREAIALLEPMAKFDPINFVRQGALIASAMILIQQTDQTCPKVTFFRQLYTQVITNKHEDVMAKYGAILAQGIIDAGGRNVTVSLQSRTGHTNLQAVVGMLVFTQYWYWFPLAHCLSLAFTPTCIIALNSDLKMPKLDFKSAARPSLYSYPAPLEEKKREERDKVATAVLSLAARAKRRTGDKKKDNNKDGDSKMEVDEDAPAAKDELSVTIKTKEDKKEKKQDKAKESGSTPSPAATGEESSSGATATTAAKTPKEPEPSFEILHNPPRVMRQQLKVISIAEGTSYTPMKDVTIGGIIMMQHKVGEEQVLVERVTAYGPKNDDLKEPEAPEPFEYIED
ncbi:26S proteasome non-ATPase regulatory subunit 1 [Toxorhynchites rutilus septentrionalis]|uniref:26S proteasome non-ATPase regulatory subunit 1 n=1 Tax=Toxorhynchites rutilus septentrionalis TaxID=329112 RepID=UPI00247AA25C|nr:26S proteasome non-ATPase regulatory subunit 1 [Toxorhynchites rutilus septentrionalis]